MTVRRLQGIPGFSIDRVAAAAGDDPEVLRLENLDTDIPPPYSAREATRKDIGRDEANSYLPFTGRRDLCETIASHVNRVAGRQLYAADQVVVTSGGTEGMLDALLAVTDPGDAVVLTDPTYAGMIYRVRLAGAEPLFVPFVVGSGQWRLDLEQLQTAVTTRTRALFLMNPSMPSGAVLSEEEWRVVAQLCRERDLWLIYNAAMERILFDGRQLRHPVALEGMAERTIVVGSLSKEYRMIGWRIGWVVGPRRVINDVARVHIYNVVTPTGIAQAGAVAALTEPSDAILPAIGEWQRRRDAMTAELRDYSIIPAAGGWSQLLDVASLGHDSFTASGLLLEQGRVAATPMRDWGDRNGDSYVRLVFSNEPVHRLRGLGQRVAGALGTGTF
jgi:aspartate/methionine/tyrosine aminotransferase